MKDSFSNFDNSDYIDLKDIFSILIRRRIFILKYTFIIFILFVLYSLIRKPLWTGSFQILINNSPITANSKANLLTLQPELTELLGANQSNPLSTEVVVLKSQLVLKPVFNYYKDYQRSTYGKIIKTNYIDWVSKNIKVELEDSSSVLNVTYTDSDKKLLLNILNMISTKYQIYSVRDKNNNLNTANEYLSTEVKKYQKRSDTAFSDAQEFALANDLGIITKVNQLQPIYNVEDIRIKSSNLLRSLDSKLSKIENLNGKDQEQYLRVLSITELENLGIYKDLDELDLRISDMKRIYKESDKLFIKVMNRRAFLINILRSKTISYLKANRFDAESSLISSKRKNGALIKYRDLLRKAAREEKTLSNLEKELQFVSLEISKSEDPWELITTPYLSDNPLISNLKFISFSSILGLIFISLIAIYKEKHLDLIYNRFQFESLIDPIPVFTLNDVSSRTFDSISHFVKRYMSLKASIDQLTFISLINKKKDISNILISDFTNSLDTKLKIKNVSDFEYSGSSHKIIFISPGIVTRSQISYFIEFNAICSQNIICFILVR